MLLGFNSISSFQLCTVLYLLEVKEAVEEKKAVLSCIARVRAVRNRMPIRRGERLSMLPVRVDVRIAGLPKVENAWGGVKIYQEY